MRRVSYGWAATLGGVLTGLFLPPLFALGVLAGFLVAHVALYLDHRAGLLAPFFDACRRLRT